LDINLPPSLRLAEDWIAQLSRRTMVLTEVSCAGTFDGKKTNSRSKNER